MAIEEIRDLEIFRAHVHEVLVSTIGERDFVVMDNLTPHKNEDTIALIENVGASIWFLPAYSPDLNPIEKMWSGQSGPASL